MLNAIQQYVHERRGGLVRSATFLYGSYALSAYISERLDEMKDKMLRNKLARDNLRRRFQSTHDDVCFTIMALMPTLASQILEDMDVEALTNELQSISRTSRSRARLPAHNPQLSQSVSELSTVSDAHSDAGSASFSSAGSTFDGDRVSSASGSWIVHPSSFEGSPARLEAPAQLSDSVTSASSSQSGQNMDDSVTSQSSRTRAQLWNEVKILALTRTLTTLYTITLLSLLTAVQLNLLGRSRYVDSVRAQDRAERERDQVPHFSLTGILAREAVAKIVDIEAIWPAWILGEIDDGGGDGDAHDTIPEETELRFLTLSWWVLHVGWRGIGARVRGAVECVFDGVSLKAKLSPSELSKLIMDVRRHIETDSTESRLGERFLPSLLPSTPEATDYMLTQGGALWVSPERGIFDNIDRFRVNSPPPFRDPNSSSLVPRDIELPIPPGESSHNTEIPIESPIPHHAVFPTPPSSHAYESDLSSRASQSPVISSVTPCLQPVSSTAVSDSLATSCSGLDVDPRFTALLAETQRYLSGPDFAYALGCALDRATEVLMDGLRARVFVDTASAVNLLNAEETQPRSGDVDASTSSKKEEIKIRLAGLLPGLARWCQLALNATPNELIDNIMAVREVNALEAIIISDYEDRFPPIS